MPRSESTQLHVLFRKSGPISGQLHCFSVSPDGRWLLSSSSAPSQNSLLLTRATRAQTHGLVDTGNTIMTSIAWESDDRFFLGSGKGDLYVGRLQDGPVSRSVCSIVIVLIMVTFPQRFSRLVLTSPGIPKPDVITAMTFSPSQRSLILAIGD